MFDDDEHNIKCAARGCPKFPLVQALETCSFEGCNKSVHFVCYAAMVKKGKDLTVFDDTKVFCTIKHHKEYVKSINVGNLTWKNDGGGGKKDEHHSEYWLIMWLGKDENFDKWREPGQGVSKIELAAGIADWVFEKGVKLKRTAQQIRCKIEHIEKLMKMAYDWENSETGVGIQESDGAVTFRETVLEKCPYYYDLKDKFTSRAGIAPKAFSSDIGSWLDSDLDESVNGDDEGGSQGADAIDTVAPTKKRKSRETSGKKPLRSKVTSLVSDSNKKRKKQTSDGDDEMEYLLKQAIKLKLKEPREDKVSKTLRLAEQFKAMALALDSKVKAANACPEFVQFLDPQEKVDLLQYNQWVESATVCDSPC